MANGNGNDGGYVIPRWFIWIITLTLGLFVPWVFALGEDVSTATKAVVEMRTDMKWLVKQVERNTAKVDHLDNYHRMSLQVRAQP